MNILAYFAHPDDETMMAGGTLALLKRLGAQVTLLCATRGEGGPMGDPPLCTREELGSVRENELRCAAHALAVDQLEFMGYVDPTIGPGEQLFPFFNDDEILAQQVAEAYLRVNADAILSHGSNGEYGHPAHRLCHRSAYRAAEILQAQGYSPIFYSMEAAYKGHLMPRLMNADDPAHLLVDCSSVIQEKRRAVLCHKTQHGLLVNFTAHELNRAVSIQEVAQMKESMHRVVPTASEGNPLKDAVADVLVASGLARDLNES